MLPRDHHCCRMDVSRGNDTSVVSRREEGAHIAEVWAGVCSPRTEQGVGGSEGETSTGVTSPPLPVDHVCFGGSDH